MFLTAHYRILDRRWQQGWTGAFAVVLTCLAMMSQGGAQPVSAHAGFVESDPEPNSVIAEAPQTVTIRFTEPLEWSYSTAELHDQRGEIVSGTSVREGADQYEMVLELPSGLPNGTYSVLWRTLSTADGHTAQNYFAFTIGSEEDVTAVAGPSADSETSGPPLWLQSASRWVAYLGLAAAVAVWPLWVLVLRPAAGSTRILARPLVQRMQTFGLVAILLALAGNLFAIAVQAASLQDGTLIDRIRSTLGDTRYGELWYLRVALVLAYAILLQWVAWWWPRRRPELTIAGLALAGSLVVPFSYIAHASAQTTGRGAAILNDVLHLLAASLWAGGLLVIVTVLIPAVRRAEADDRRAVLSRALHRFSTLALIAWTTMALTGVYSAWLQVGTIDGLLDTDYGNALLIKLVLLVPILALAAFNLFVVTSRLERLASQATRTATWTRRFLYAVGAEVLLAIAVLLVVGSLTAQAPARESIGTTANPTEISLTGGEREASLTIDPGTPGPNRFQLTLGGDPLPHDADVLLRVSSSDQDTGEKELEFAHGDTNTYTYQGSELSLAGDWDFELVIRPPGAFEWRAYASATIEPETAAEGGSRPSWVLSSVGGTIGVALLTLGTVALITGWRSPQARFRTSLLATGATAIFTGAIVVASTRTEIGSMSAAVLARFA